MALVEADFALFEFVFKLLNELVALAYFFFEFGLFVEILFFYFQEFFLLDNLRLAVGFVEDAVLRFLQDISEKGVSAHCTDHEAGQNADQWFHHISKVKISRMKNKKNKTLGQAAMRGTGVEG